MSFSIINSCTGCGACIKLCPAGAISGTKKEQHLINAVLCIECGACGRICPASAVLDNQGITVQKMKKSEWPKPIINAEKCFACENCVDACPTHALAMADEKLPFAMNRAVLAQPTKCVSCGWCKNNCLFDAIILGAPS